MRHLTVRSLKQHLPQQLVALRVEANLGQLIITKAVILSGISVIMNDHLD